MKKNKIKFFLIVTLISFCNNPTQKYSSTNDCLNAFNVGEIESSDINEQFIIAGHAYGSHQSDNPALSYQFLNFLDKNKSKEYSIILTGDFIRNSTLENMNVLKKQLDQYSSNYYFSIGNHDIDYGRSEAFYKVFENDLDLISFGNVDLVIANFSNFNWEPKDSDKKAINSFLKDSKSKYIIIFSHQIFWEEMVVNPIQKNADDLLEVPLKKNALDWLERSEKTVIIVSGDYGLHEYETYCEHNTETDTLFIANGLYDRDTDTVLELTISDQDFRFLEIIVSD
tara:strand:+ start:990 stop:1838 length:849 start_codon:yes stop_codon:yes gene_type:complete